MIVLELCPQRRGRIKMPCDIIRSGWNSIMESMVSMKHGGAIAVLPEDMTFDSPLPNTVQELFDVSFRSMNVDFGRQAYDLVSQSRRLPKKDLVAAHDRFADSVDVIAQLTNVDGCVVFDHRLRLAGFGWVIRGHDLSGRSNKVTHVDLKGEPDGEESLEHLGTRHRSAARLCRLTGSRTAPP